MRHTEIVILADFFAAMPRTRHWKLFCFCKLSINVDIEFDQYIIRKPDQPVTLPAELAAPKALSSADCGVPNLT